MRCGRIVESRQALAQRPVSRNTVGPASVASRPRSRYNPLMVKTKIVATLGPGSESTEVLADMLDAGMDVVRLNFSHGSNQDRLDVLERVRTLADERRRAVTIIGDLCGPKIRLRGVDPARATLGVGDSVVIGATPGTGDRPRVFTTYANMVNCVSIGDRVLIADGTIGLRVIAKQADEIECRCELPGTLEDRKGVNLPDSTVDLPSLTDKDLADVEWAVANGVDYLALSFVRQADDVEALRREIARHNGHQQIISKIETAAAIEVIDEIIAASDAILVARGDLGVEMELARVPLLQKSITRRSRLAAKPVIIATEMLQSMVESPTPTRAEVSDIANAVLDKVDAVMLSAETAIGHYPTGAVQTMNNIIAATEAFEPSTGSTRAPDGAVSGPGDTVTAAVARSAALVAADLKPRVLVAWTRLGRTVRLLSRYRPEIPVIALTPDKAICRRVSLYYGVTAVHTDRPNDETVRRRLIDGLLRDGGWAEPGDTVVIVAGPDSPSAALSNAIVVHQVGPLDQ